ncbi:MAG: NAD(P)/FAD-dependent oxidoreductase [Phycisphaeraceae bacterium]|nr:NAD(P)/FAD-dependent oxidoreductase [Phycisphaeraceae bacterium]
MHDVIIIGAGPAGLSAALVLARCRRDIVLIDHGHGRNRFARNMNGFLTRDGVPPKEFRELARRDLSKYQIRCIDEEVVHACPEGNGFLVTLKSGEGLRARKVLLATGVSDLLPRLDGFMECYGKTVHHCPYCDGYEHRDQRIATYGRGNAAIGIALTLRTWSADVTACLDGEEADDSHIAIAKKNGITVRRELVTRLHHEEGELRALHFARGEPLNADAMFFNTGQVQRSGLPKLLNCAFDNDGGVKTADRQQTTIPGLFLAGDADKEVQFVIVAAAQGATAAVGINRELQDEERGTPAPPSHRAPTPSS